MTGKKRRHCYWDAFFTSTFGRRLRGGIAEGEVGNKRPIVGPVPRSFARRGLTKHVVRECTTGGRVSICAGEGYASPVVSFLLSSGRFDGKRAP